MFSVVSSSSFFLLEFWVFWFCREFRELQSILDLTLSFFFQYFRVRSCGMFRVMCFRCILSLDWKVLSASSDKSCLERLESFLVMVWFFAF
jgi:hypothetical protein